ncbi:cytochrome P450 [Nocardia sp. NPDC004860]|uniref:cytochrome P450 n=1 Tax=Nocardia sp. NPDC004860 TaxID=3154557 RepID=UPI0033AC88C5
MTDINEPPPFPFPYHERRLAPEFADRRKSCPFGTVRLQSGHDAVLLVRNADVAAALADTRLSHDLTAPGSPRFVEGPSYLDDPTMFANMEGAEHRRIRRIIASAFTPQSIATWHPMIEQVATELAEALDHGGHRADVMSDFCIPLPVTIIRRLIGVPESDAPQFRAWSNAFVSGAKMTLEQRIQQMSEFTGYVAELIAYKRTRPGTDLIDNLIAARDGDDRLSEPELVTLVTSTIAGGNETTSNSLGRHLVTLLDEDAALWKRLVADQDLIPAAVDELLRTTKLGAFFPMRLATEDVDLPSGRIREGQAVVVAVASGLRDESVYSDPETIQLDRPPVPTLAFGRGPHTCLGINLALAELRIGLRVLVEHFPSLRLDCDVDELRYTEGGLLSSLISLPLAW